MKRFGLSALRRIKRDERGASAVEFGMFAPILLFGVLATVDIGMALGERMEMDHVVRAGAESAMIKYSESDVLSVMQATAAVNFSMGSQGEEEVEGGLPLSLSADQFCACSGSTVSCSNVCTGDAPPNVFVEVAASKTYEGLILPDLNFSAGMRVQLR